jgi:type 2 lantibiotic biosynthesis protein LanM
LYFLGEDVFMEEATSQSHIYGQKSGVSADWYRAMTLTERMATLQGHRNTQDTLASNSAAIQRFQYWKGQAPFDKGTYFEQRLEQSGLTEHDLLALLAEPIEVLQARTATQPLWLTNLIETYADNNDDEFIWPRLPLKENTPAAFLDMLKPLLKSGMKRLQAGVQELVRTASHLPFEPQNVIEMCFAHIIERLLPHMLRTIVLELNIARVQGRLQGTTAEERFLSFLQRLAQPEGMLPLLQEYTVLARHIVETVDRWVNNELELLTRLCADWTEIHAIFTPADDPGVLVKIQGDMGDTHRGGHTVTLLTWSSGFSLVYKPHSMAVDVHFQMLLERLNHLLQSPQRRLRGDAPDCQPPFRILRVYDKGTYGWAEFVYGASCASKEEVERFYLRQGGYLALLYALEASDFHAENLIASGEHPMLIDLETLFQPRMKLQVTLQQGYPGIETIGYSVLRSGLLPQRLWSNNDAEGVDISGLGGHAGQLTPTPVTKWRSIGTDQMRLGRERIEIPLGHNRPKLQGQDIDVMAYCEYIIAGFTNVYRLLMQHRDELLTNLLPCFAHDEIRCILRPTKIYGMLLSDSFHPNVLRDALERQRLLDRLWIGVEYQPHLARIIPAEQADIWNGDIPLFTTHPDTLDLYTSHGERTAGFFEETGLTMVMRRVQDLSEQDLEKQIWIIRASFTSMTLGTDGHSQKIISLQPSGSEVSYERLVAMAEAIGERLRVLALHTEETVGWLGIGPVNEREWHLLPAGADIYSGTAGIALFLGYLGKLTGKETYTDLACVALRTVRQQVALQVASGGGSVGAFEGLGGYIYLLAHLGALWKDVALYKEAEELTAYLAQRIEQDQTFDWLSGSAGCIAALLSLHSVAPSEVTLATAMRCGEHLIQCARPMTVGVGWPTERQKIPLTGLAHGNAGIALSLLYLFAASGEERFRQMALDAIAYERSLFSVEKQNWPDLRTSIVTARTPEMGEKRGDDVKEQAYMIAWCHGAAGIGLARLGALRVLNDTATHAEVDAALQAMLQGGFGENHSLCHGDMGNLDILLTATQLLKDAYYQEQLRHITPMLLDSIDVCGWVSGVPQGVETPGLMTGLAGIGYALLRLASPTSVPSILLLAPPRSVGT